MEYYSKLGERLYPQSDVDLKIRIAREEERWHTLAEVEKKLPPRAARNETRVRVLSKLREHYARCLSEDAQDGTDFDCAVLEALSDSRIFEEEPTSVEILKTVLAEWDKMSPQEQKDAVRRAVQAATGQ